MNSKSRRSRKHLQKSRLSSGTANVASNEKAQTGDPDLLEQFVSGKEEKTSEEGIVIDFGGVERS